MGFFDFFSRDSRNYFVLTLKGESFPISDKELAAISDYYSISLHDPNLVIRVFNEDIQKFLDLMFKYETISSKIVASKESVSFMKKGLVSKRSVVGYSMEALDEVDALSEDETKLSKTLRVVGLELRQQAQVLIDIINHIRIKVPKSKLLRLISPSFYEIYSKEVSKLPLLKSIKS
ncbi:hypothetical protein J4216_00720 [Candidatus Woesearchaeota archaeon]|nr:hypothetical protein [Candidatus Woesearchaeota archaeon]